MTFAWTVAADPRYPKERSPEGWRPKDPYGWFYPELWIPRPAKHRLPDWVEPWYDPREDAEMN